MYCQCGCGQKTRLAPQTHRAQGWVRGQSLKCLKGHNTKSLQKWREDPATGCWIWLRSYGGNGYGQCPSGGRNHNAHRAVYEELRGPVPNGCVLDHKCRNPSCVNPDHMEPISQAENVRRGRKAVLTHDIVREIKRLQSQGVRSIDISRRLGLNKNTVYAVTCGFNWKDVG
jgi:hypothetical protein